MRCPGLLALPLALLAAPLVAQGFEGQVSMKLTTDQQPITMDWTLKGTKTLVRVTADIPQLGGPTELKMIMDNAAQNTTVLMPVPAQFAQMFPGVVGMKIVLDNKAAAGRGGNATTTIVPKKLSTSQTIAGVRCDDYDLNDSLKTRACISTSLGGFTLPNMAGGARGGRGGAGMFGNILGSVPSWAGSLGSAGFPLKVWTPADGKVLMEVTDIKPGSVSVETFAIPDGYQDMSALGGAGRGGAGGGGGRGGGR